MERVDVGAMVEAGSTGDVTETVERLTGFVEPWMPALQG